MKDKKKLEVLLKVKQRVCDKNVGSKEAMDSSMVEVCTEEGVSPEQVFFIFLFLCCCLYHNGYSRKNLSKSAEERKKSSCKF